MKFKSADDGKEVAVRRCAGIQELLAVHTAGDGTVSSLRSLILDSRFVSRYGWLFLPLVRAELEYAAPPDIAISDPRRSIAPVLVIPNSWVPKLATQSLRTHSPTTESLDVRSDWTKSGFPEPFEGYNGSRLLGTLECARELATDTSGRTAIRQSRLMGLFKGSLKRVELRTDVVVGLGCMATQLYLSTGRRMGLGRQFSPTVSIFRSSVPRRFFPLLMNCSLGFGSMWVFFGTLTIFKGSTGYSPSASA